jgi:hypothetical protein
LNKEFFNKKEKGMISAEAGDAEDVKSRSDLSRSNRGCIKKENFAGKPGRN